MKPHSKDKQRKPRLFAPYVYERFSWYCCVLKARERHQHLSKKFDEFAGQDFCHENLLLINRELEVIEDYFDWLQMEV